MILRLILGVVYTAMAVGQAASWPHMPGILAAYQAPGVASPVYAAVLIAAELVCGLWLLLRPRSHALTPVWIYTTVTLLWAGLGLQGVLRGLEVANCGCFGAYLTQRLSWFVLAQNALLLVYAGLMLRAARRTRTAAMVAVRSPQRFSRTQAPCSEPAVRSQSRTPLDPGKRE